MAASVVQQAVGSTGSATTFTSVTPTFASASVSGHSVLLIVGSDGTVATPSGWTLDRSQVNNDGHYVYRRTSTGETAFAAVTVTAATVWQLIELSAAVTLDGVISAGTTLSVSSLSTGTTPTLAQSDEIAVATWVSSAATPPTFSALTNSYVALASGNTKTTKTSGVNVNMLTATKSALGATETSTATLSASSPCTAVLVTYRIGSAVVAPMRRVGKFAY